MRRRILFMLVMGGALLAFTPALALARHHGARHHSRHHARHHSRVRLERFGTLMPSQPGAGGSDATGPPRSGQENENAGTVASFQNGILTIALNDGTMVSGRVTSNTEMECEAPESSSTMHRDDDGGSRGDQRENAGQAQENEDENAGDEEGAQNCSSASLQRGTVVREAELRISSGGSTWDKVELITSSAGSNESGGSET